MIVSMRISALLITTATFVALSGLTFAQSEKISFKPKILVGKNM